MRTISYTLQYLVGCIYQICVSYTTGSQKTDEYLYIYTYIIYLIVFMVMMNTSEITQKVSEIVHTITHIHENSRICTDVCMRES